MNSEAIARKIQEGSSFLLTTHVSGDGDGLGAELAMLRLLRAMGKEVKILNPDQHDRRFDFLLEEGEEIEFYDPDRHSDLIDRTDFIILLDVSTYNRLGKLGEALAAAPIKKLCIDHHHPGNDSYDEAWIREDACATGLMVFELLVEQGWTLTRSIAEPLYVSLVTDTGSFHYARTTPEVHRMAALLVEQGVQPQDIFEKLYEQQSLSTVRLTGEILAGMQTACDGKVAWQKISQAMLANRNGAMEEIADVVNYTIALADCEVGIQFKELEPGMTKASLRSKGRVDVAAFARTLGGGGHRHAAGIVLEEEFDKGCDIVVSALLETMKGLD